MTFWSPGPLCGEGNSTANARSEDTATIASRIALAREEFRLDHFASDLAFDFKLTITNYSITNSSRLLRLSTHILFCFLRISSTLHAARRGRIGGIQLHCFLKIVDGLRVITFVECCVSQLNQLICSAAVRTL